MTDAQLTKALAAAGAAQAAGQTATAAAQFEAVLRMVPAHPAALNSLGVMALNAGDLPRAVDFHTRAAAADARAPVLWVNLAKAQRAAGDDAGERASLEAALALDRLMFTALLRKAELHERLGETRAAVEGWQAVLATAPAQPPTALAVALAHGRDYVAATTARFAADLDAGLASDRADADGDLRRFDACMGVMTGRRSVYPNVCAGTHFPFLPADEFFDRAHFAWLAALEAATPAIAAELADLLATGAPGFEPYVRLDAGTPENLWSRLDASTDWSAYYLWQYGKPVADAHARCPATAEALRQAPLIELPGRSPSAFFSILRPGARIPPHTGVTNIRGIVHLPLIVPEHCAFRVGGETREWRVGEAFVFDDTIEHEAWNDSDALRAVLILDVWNPHLTPTERAMLARYFAVADASGQDGDRF